jgi:DNA-directed RNA polymerase subunit beta
MIDEVIKASKEMHGSHAFLSEELMVPNLNKCDSTRTNMFCNHFVQSVVPINGDFPKVFTNFENQVGKYSSSYKVADRDWKILYKIKKNDLNYIYVLYDEEKKYIHIINFKEAERITEKYGYSYESLVKDKQEGDIINKDELIYRSAAHDNDLNFRFGHNLKALFLAYNNKTYEDALVISEEVCDKLACHNVEDVEISINTNDVLINKYGKNGEYKCFPDIGEELDDRILCARRRINNDSILTDLMDSNITKINLDTDTIFYTQLGKVIDIDVYSNMPVETLSKYKYNTQLIKYINDLQHYYAEIVDKLKTYYEDESITKSDDFNYTYKRALDYINEKRKFRYDGNTFDNIMLKIKVLSVNRVKIGSKLSGRYGNKGCVSLILPKEKMPCNEYGEHADIILNPLGVISRMNIAQNYEQELNYFGDNIVRLMKKEDTNEARFNVLIDFLNDVNKTYAEYIEKTYNDLDIDGQNAFFNEIFEKGIFIHQPPFFGNITMDQMAHLYEKYGFDGYTINTNINDQPAQRKLIMGDMYFMRLILAALKLL